MKESALKIDQVMDELIPWVVKGLTEKELNAKCVELCKKVGFQGLSCDYSYSFSYRLDKS